MAKEVDAYGIKTLKRLMQQLKEKDEKLKQSQAEFLDRKQGTAAKPWNKDIESSKKVDVNTNTKLEEENEEEEDDFVIQKNVELHEKFLRREENRKQIVQELREQQDGNEQGLEELNEAFLSRLNHEAVQTTEETKKTLDEEETTRAHAEDSVTHGYLTEEQIQGFRESFVLFDTDNDGKITLDEIRAVLAALGQTITPGLTTLLEEYDKNNNGMIEFEEFLDIMIKMKEMYGSDEYVGTPGVVLTNESTGNPESYNLKKAIQDIVNDENLDEEFRDLAAAGNTSGMMELIRRGANINSKSEKTGFTALHRACAENAISAVEFLLKQPGIDFNPISKFGLKPIELATTKQKEIEKLFEEAEKAQGKEELLETLAAATSGPLPRPAGEFHVYLSHVYGEHQKAVSLQSQLERLGAKVFAPNSLMSKDDIVEQDLSRCDTVIVMLTKQYVRNLQNERSGVYTEFELIKIVKPDVEREIIYILCDSKLDKNDDSLSSLPGYPESKKLSMKNEKEMSENAALLYKELHTRLLM